MNRCRLLCALVLGTLLMSGCQLDVNVAVDMEPDGTGTVTVDAVADAELIEQVPGVVDDLRLQDAVDNGWRVEGPTSEADGGATITLTHDFSSAAELANVLNSIGPPLRDVGIARTIGEERTTNAIDAELELANGLATFADDDLISVVGDVPFGLDEGVAAEEALAFRLQVRLPGELQRAETGRDLGDGVIEWVAPLDGSSLEVTAETVQQAPGDGNSWAGPVSTVAFVLFVVWCVAAAGFIVFVAIARRRKAQRRRAAVRHLDR